MAPPRWTCPECGSRRVVPIVYGLVGPDGMEAARRGGIALGGCLVTDDDPDLRCRACGHAWRADRVFA